MQKCDSQQQQKQQHKIEYINTLERVNTEPRELYTTNLFARRMSVQQSSSISLAVYHLLNDVKVTAFALCTKVVTVLGCSGI